jgi:hypothetical protein
MILILRGHIRDSFNDGLLAFFVSYLVSKYDVKIYIHTWNIFANDISWRPFQENTNIVTKEIIKNYFHESIKNIVSIEIENDNDIILNGRLEGNVYSSLSPIIGWKRMWYQKVKLFEKMKKFDEKDEEFVINTRFDLFIFSCAFNFEKICDFIIDSLNENEIQKRNVFYLNEKQHGLCGCECFVIGNVKNMSILVNAFHNGLDEFHSIFSDNYHPETTVIDVNKILFINNV